MCQGALYLPVFAEADLQQNFPSARCKALKTQSADVAQLVEQSIRNRQVSGSIPLVGSSLNS